MQFYIGDGKAIAAAHGMSDADGVMTLQQLRIQVRAFSVFSLTSPFPPDATPPFSLYITEMLVFCIRTQRGT